MPIDYYNASPPEPDECDRDDCEYYNEDCLSNCQRVEDGDECKDYIDPETLADMKFHREREEG